MGLFVCDICNNVENTSLGSFWSRHKHERFFGIENGKALCSACTPPMFLDGSKNSKGGKWHNRFTMKKWDGVQKVENR
jgi:hypothetical protein